MSRVPPQGQTTSQNRPTARERLDSWKEIASYLNRDVRTVQRWEETDGLPVHRRAEGRQKGSPVYAFTSEIDAWLHKNPPSNMEKEAEFGPAAHDGWRTRRVFWVIAMLFILASGGVVIWRFLNRQSAVLPLHVMTLTSYPGVERFPAFSPDGKQVVFDWSGPSQDNHDLYVKFLGGGEHGVLLCFSGIWPLRWTL